MLAFIIALGAVLGALDSVHHNKWGLGEKFEEGFLSLGSVALSIAGIICIAPSLALLAQPVAVPFFRILHMDPSVFGSLLANNMGGYPLAEALADDPQIGKYSGLVLSSLLGATLVYTIPVGLGIIPSALYRFFLLLAKGIQAVAVLGLGWLHLPV